MKYECNTDQRHVNEPKTGHDATRCDPKKDRMLKHDCFPLRAPRLPFFLVRTKRTKPTKLHMWTHRDCHKLYH